MMILVIILQKKLMTEKWKMLLKTELEPTSTEEDKNAKSFPEEEKQTNHAVPEDVKRSK